ncbi:MAG TPA: hypothetical protein V6D19_09175 [Stenomitos sp.]
MKAIQLELDFQGAIAQALAEPEVADIKQLWLSLEPELKELSQEKQLQVAAQALCDLAEVCQRRAEMMWREWVDLHNTEGPIPDEDFLAGLVQKSMFLDISALVRQPKSRKRAKDIVAEDGESIVQEVTKEQALLLAEAGPESTPEPEQVFMRPEYDEDIAAWSEVIRGWLTRQGIEEEAITHLRHETGLSVVKLWLAGLLGGFGLVQTGEFYEGVVITLR